MADNFNINTTQDQANEAEGLERDNPSMTYVDFANQMVRNSQSQQQQAALIAQAQELAKQQKLKTGQETAAAGEGINPSTKGYMSKDEALALIQAELSRQKLLSDDVKAALQTWYNAAPQMVEQQDVKDFISRYQPKSAKVGAPFQATAADAADTDKTDESGKPLVEGQMYSVTQDADGNTIYQRGGVDKEGAVQDKADAKQNALDEHQLADLGKELSKVTNPSRGNFISQNIGRAFRALNEIQRHPDLPKPTLQYIQEEVGGIFMGGVPPESALAAADVTNAKQQINALINKYTGVVQYFNKGSITDQSNYLNSLLISLYQSTTSMAKSLMEAKIQAYPGLIERRPDDVKKLLDSHEAILSKGLTEEAQTKVTEEGKGKTSAAPAANAAPAAAPAANDPLGIR